HHHGEEAFGYALGGFLAVGIVLTLIGLLIRLVGTSWIDVIFPPAAMGAIIAVIGLELVPTAAEMAGWIPDADDPADRSINVTEASVAAFTLMITIVFWVTLRGFLKIIPILLGIIAGYIIAWSFGILDYHQWRKLLGLVCQNYMRLSSTGPVFS